MRDLTVSEIKQIAGSMQLFEVDCHCSRIWLDGCSWYMITPILYVFCQREFLWVILQMSNKLLSIVELCMIFLPLYFNVRLASLPAV
jgi:hypothetical protein